MYGKVTIGGKEVEFSANAATSFRFKNLFGIDLFSVIGKGENAEVEEYERLAFIMNRQAEGAEWNKLTVEDFYAWLESFEPTDLVNALPDILNIYMSNRKGDSDPK